MRGRVRSWRPSARRPPEFRSPGESGCGPESGAPFARPHPWGSCFGDVTWARIAPGGLARIERRRIMSRWARTARGEVDCVALISHCASRARVLPSWSAPPQARRRPARASARGRREPGPGPCPIPSCLRPGPQDHRPSPRGCSLGGPARRRGRGARRCPDSRRDPARGLSHRHLRVGVHPAPRPQDRREQDRQRRDEDPHGYSDEARPRPGGEDDNEPATWGVCADRMDDPSRER